MNNDNNNNYKTSIVQGLGKLIVWVQCKVHPSTMIRWQGNLGRISESEKVSFEMVTEIPSSYINITTENYLSTFIHQNNYIQ